MCESGKQCFEEKSSGTQVAQLKRLIWVLMIWASVLSLGLGASITLHIYQQRSGTVTSPPTTNSPANTHSQLTSYYLSKKPMKDSEMQWIKTNEGTTEGIRIEEDGNYFLFLRLTLDSPNTSGNYTVRVNKEPENSSPEEIIVHHIYGKESTGLIGRGIYLSHNTRINVTVTPKAKFNYYNTQLGLIKF